MRRSGEVLSLASFVALGLPDGMLGTAWPEMRHSFSAPIGDLGLILLLSTAGSVSITFLVGRLLRRLGVAALLAVGAVSAASAAVGFSVAPGFGVVLALSVLFGVAAGLMDAGLNTAVGLSGRNRLLNLLHGAYGVGTAVGPVVVTLSVLSGSWRPAYVVLLVVDVVVASCWMVLRRRDPGLGAAGGPPAMPAPPAVPTPDVAAGAGSAAAHSIPSPPGLRRRSAIAAGIATFFVYTGLEVAAGQWETTYAKGQLHLSTSAAGMATFGYWAALTAVRVVLAFLPRPPSGQTVVRWGVTVSLVAAGCIWWEPVAAVAIVGFVVLGGAQAGVFPALIGLTPVRLGSNLAARAISWQVGAAAAGGAAVSALVGLVIGRAGVASLGPAVTVLAVLLVALERILGRVAPAP